MKISVRTIIFAIIIIICIFAINFGVYWQFFKDKDDQNENTISTNITQDDLAKNFKNIFDNTLDYQDNSMNVSGITKIDSSKDIIYTWVTKESIVDNKYDLNLNIPRVNISNTSVEKFNEKIKELYVDKANDIITKAKNNTNSIYNVYTVEYMSYINSNILSLVIKATLKEGNNPQRVIIQTYNYNLSTNEEITFKQMLEIKGLQEQSVKNTILNKVQNSNTEARYFKEFRL